MKKWPVFLKLTTLLLVTTTILTFKNSIFLTVLLVILCLGAWAYYRSFFFSRFKILLFIGISVIVFQLLFNQGLSVYTRLSYGYLAAVRICSASMVVFVIMKILSPTEMLLFFDFLPKNAQLIIAMTFSLIPVIISEQEQIALVQKSRTQPKSIFNDFTGVVSIIIPLMHRVLRRAETISMTIVSRGYI